MADINNKFYTINTILTLFTEQHYVYTLSCDNKVRLPARRIARLSQQNGTFHSNLSEDQFQLAPVSEDDVTRQSPTDGPS